MSFPSASNQYDAADVDATIVSFEGELAEEQALAATLDDSVDKKMADAAAFLAANAPVVAAQQARLRELDGQLREIVEQNKVKIAKDKQYEELINSQPYVDLANQLLDIKATAKALHEYLVDAGVRGQPRARSATSSKSSQ